MEFISRIRKYVCVAIFLSGSAAVYAGGRINENSRTAVNNNSKVPDQEFSWSEKRKLTWDDFKGPAGNEFGEWAAAATFCGFGFEAASSGHNTEVKIFNQFQPSRSWVKHEHKCDAILAHEQCHFDICELFTRKLKMKMEAQRLSGNVSQHLNSIYESVRNEYMAFQDQYESETNHGLIEDAQKQWQNIVADELMKTSGYADRIFTLRQ
jgi:hypothetical protein